MKAYVLNDLNDPTKLKIEFRSNSQGTICEAPKQNGQWVTDIDVIDVVEVAETMPQPRQSVDGNGDPIVDAEGNPVYETDVNGDIIYDDVPTGMTHFEAQISSTKQAQKDSELLQSKRNAKLERIRQIREPLLKEVDIMINELTLGDRTDTAAVKTYRNELKALTDAYKDVTDSTGKTALNTIDNLADDLSDLVLPTKP